MQNQAASGNRTRGPLTSLVRPFRALLVDENRHFRELFLQFLRDDCAKEIVVTGAAATFDQLPVNMESLRPDLFFLDLGLPGLRGLPWIAHLRDLFPRGRIVVLSLLDKPDYRQRALEAGADYFVTKDDIFFSLPAILRDLKAASSPIKARRGLKSH